MLIDALHRSRDVIVAADANTVLDVFACSPRWCVARNAPMDIDFVVDFMPAEAGIQ